MLHYLQGREENMKRIIIFIFVLLALLATVALGEGNRLIEMEEDYINDLLTDGDALYILGEGQVYVWRPGTTRLPGWTSSPCTMGRKRDAITASSCSQGKAA
jgi:hypothetical protein